MQLKKEKTFKLINSRKICLHDILIPTFLTTSLVLNSHFIPHHRCLHPLCKNLEVEAQMYLNKEYWTKSVRSVTAQEAVEVQFLSS